MRTARRSELARMVKVISHPERTPRSLSKLGKRWFAFFKGLVALSYDAIAAPLGCICDAEHRAAGQTRSERTAYRALRELEIGGYIKRPRRPSGETRIAFLPALYVSYISAPLPNCQALLIPDQVGSDPDRKPINPRSQIGPSEAITGSANGSRAALAGLAPRQVTPHAPLHRAPPPLYSLRRVCMAAADRPAVLALAASEYAARRSAARPLSGIDWQHETERWNLMSIPEREHIAAGELLPALRRALAGDPPEAIASRGCPESPDRLVAQLLGSLEPHAEPQAPCYVVRRSAPPTPPPPSAILEISPDLSDSDLAILARARDRAAIRRSA